jgi:hypothetical protein
MLSRAKVVLTVAVGLTLAIWYSVEVACTEHSAVSDVDSNVGKHGLAQSSTFGRPSAADDNEELLTFSSKDILELSNVQFATKTFSTSKKCQMYEEILRQMLEGRPQASMDAVDLFKLFVLSLARRAPLYGNKEPPYVQSLKECIGELSVQQAHSGGSKLTAGPRRQERAPLRDTQDEFVKVRERVVGFGQDLYSDTGARRDGGQRSDYDRMEKKQLDELIEGEQDPVKKLQMKLARERRRTKLLLRHFDGNGSEIDQLFKQNYNSLKSGSRTAGHSNEFKDEFRLKMMESLYDLASQREKKAENQLEELSRQLAEMKALLASRVLEHEDKDKDKDSETTSSKSEESIDDKCKEYNVLVKELGKLAKRTLRMVVPASFGNFLRYYTGYVPLSRVQELRTALLELEDCLERERAKAESGKSTDAAAS